MNQTTINQEPVSTLTDDSFFGLSKREVEALCEKGVPTYRTEIALRQVSATSVENVRMYKVGSDYVVIVVDDSSGVVRWGVMRTTDSWIQLKAELDPMQASDWDFARAQAEAINSLCFYSRDFSESKRR
jgi:hypothetical protein